MAKYPNKFVTTYAEYQWDGEKYVLVHREGYDYAGQWALATHDREPTWVIESYRWRNDDGSESTATWAQTQDTALTTGVGPGGQMRLRMSFGETNNATVNNTGSWTLEYRVNTGGGFGSWLTVGATGAVHYFDSSNLTNTTAITTERLTNATLSGGATFTNGFGDENEDGVTPSQTWADNYGEAEFALEFDSAQSDGDVFEFRLLSPQSTNPTPENTPSITLQVLNATANPPTAVISGDAGTVTAEATSPRPAVDFGRAGPLGLHHNYGDDFSKAPPAPGINRPLALTGVG